MDPADKPASGTYQPEAEASGLEGTGKEGAHDFEAQKRIHQQIRNDPDYDDWEYGTEPLPHEAWRGGAPNPNPPSPQERS